MSPCRSEPPRCSESPMAGVPHRQVQHLQDRLRVGNCPRFRVTVGGTRGRGGGLRAGRGRGTPGSGGGRASSRRRTGATGIRSKGPIRRRLWSRRCAGAVTSSVSGRWVRRTELFDFGALGSASAKQHVRRVAVAIVTAVVVAPVVRGSVWPDCFLHVLQPLPTGPLAKDHARQHMYRVTGQVAPFERIPVAPLEDPSCVTRYTDRSKTAYEHA